MSVGKLGSSWKTFRLGGGGVRGGFLLLSCGVVGGVIVMLWGVLRFHPPQYVGKAKDSKGLSVLTRDPWFEGGLSEDGTVDTETQEGCWLFPLEDERVPCIHVTAAGQGESSEGGIRWFSWRTSDEFHTKSSLYSPPA